METSKNKNWMELIEEWEDECCKKLDLEKKNKENFIYANLRNLIDSFDKTERTCFRFFIMLKLHVAVIRISDKYSAERKPYENDLIFVLPIDHI